MDFPLNHLEYSLDLYTAHLGTETQTQNVCGEEFTFPIDLGFSADEINAMNRVIIETGFSGPEPEGEGFALYSGEREALRIRGPLFVGPLVVNSLGVELTVRTLDVADPKLAALFQIAFEGNAVVLDGKHACRVCRDVLPEHLFRWPTITRIDSASALLEWLRTSARARPVHVPTRANHDRRTRR